MQLTSPDNERRRSEARAAPSTGQSGLDAQQLNYVQKIHAAAQREKSEPRAGLEPLPLWFIALLGFAVFFGGFYFGRYAGDFSSASLEARGGEQLAQKSAASAAGGQAQSVELTPAMRGKKIFLANCAGQRHRGCGTISTAGWL